MLACPPVPLSIMDLQSFVFKFSSLAFVEFVQRLGGSAAQQFSGSAPQWLSSGTAAQFFSKVS